MPTTLGEFLRARRETIERSDERDHNAARRRRTPGLRREEVAVRAGISADYYARLEQGRENHPSAHVLDALVFALGLSPREARYLHDLATPRHRWRQETNLRQQIPSDYLLEIMQIWPLGPAYIVNRRCDVLAENQQASELFSQFTITGNILRLLFLDPEAKTVWINWQSYVKTAIAILHQTAGIDIDQPDIAELVNELSKDSSEFFRMWNSHDIDVSDSRVKHLRHREFGEVVFDYDLLSVASKPGQYLVIHRGSTHVLT